MSSHSQQWPCSPGTSPRHLVCVLQGLNTVLGCSTMAQRQSRAGIFLLLQELGFGKGSHTGLLAALPCRLLVSPLECVALCWLLYSWVISRFSWVLHARMSAAAWGGLLFPCAVVLCLMGPCLGPGRRGAPQPGGAEQRAASLTPRGQSSTNPSHRDLSLSKKQFHAGGNLRCLQAGGCWEMSQNLITQSHEFPTWSSAGFHGGNLRQNLFLHPENHIQEMKFSSMKCSGG